MPKTRLTARAGSTHTWRHESVAFLDYLREHDGRLPTAEAFPTSRAELFRRLLRWPGPEAYVGLALERLARRLPGTGQAVVSRFAGSVLGRAHPSPL